MPKIQQATEIRVPLPSAAEQYYRHGWQSWSLTAWQDANRHISPPKPARLLPLQTDPHYVYELRPHGSWVGAVEMQNKRILLLGALGLDAHVTLDGNTLIGIYESGTGDWFIDEGEEDEVFARYAAQLAKRLGIYRTTATPNIWCSWYSFYTHISEKRLATVLNDLNGHPFDVFQVDDGWQRAIGDWIPNEKFPSGMDDFAARIRRSGRTPGLWLAPLIVVPSSTLYHQHPNWLLHDKNGKLVSAGFNWGESLYALDTSHPEVLMWLAALMKQVRIWGYDYVKLDFLYAGALPGVRHNDTPREQAYRQGLRTIRDALGCAYLLTCGAPIIPSIGLCDGLRVGPDVASYWASSRDDILLGNFAVPGTRNAVRTTVNRLWLSPLIHPDPDVVYFASSKNTMTSEQENMLQDLALVCNYKATSDLPTWLNNEERVTLKNFLSASPKIARKGRYRFSVAGRDVDFSSAMEIPQAITSVQKLMGFLLGWAGNQPMILKITQWLGDRAVSANFSD